MCIEDIRLGRKSGSFQNNVSINNATSQLLAANNSKRIAIVISPPQTGFITISLASEAVLNNGIRLEPTSNPLCLDIQKHGALCTMPITAIHSAATETISTWETILDAD